MRVLIFTLLIVLINGCASLDLSMEEWPRYFGEKYGVSTIDDSFLAEPENRQKVAFIYRILANTSEVYIHKMNDAINNSVFLHEDGHREAVYDSNGDLVTDCVNKGSYNYYHPHKQPLMHFTFDILPWLEWGNCRKDTTTIEQRASAYLIDLSIGIKEALENNSAVMLPVNMKFNTEGQRLAIAFFFEALEDVPHTALYNLMDADQSIKESDLETCLKYIEDGFKGVLLSHK